VPLNTITHMADIVSAANSIHRSMQRAGMGLEGPILTHRVLAQMSGVRVQKSANLPRSALFCIVQRRHSFQVLVESTLSPEERRAAVARALGHIDLHWRSGAWIGSHQPREQAEAQAGRYAIALLAPSWSVLRLLQSPDTTTPALDEREASADLQAARIAQALRVPSWMVSTMLAAMQTYDGGDQLRQAAERTRRARRKGAQRRQSLGGST